MIVFYARVSSEDQNEARQVESAHQVNAEKIYLDKLSGKNTARPQLKEMMSFVREGDVVVVSEISRLARNTKDLLIIVEQLQKKKVDFRSLKENLDTSTPQGRFVLTIFGALAELEREMIHQRQTEGIAIAKALGKYTGRTPAAIDEKAFLTACADWRQGKRTATSVAKQFGFSRDTFYRKVRRMGLSRNGDA